MAGPGTIPPVPGRWRGSRPPRLVGLHWRAFLWLSAFLIAVSTAFYALIHQNLMGQFRAQRTAEVESYTRQVQALFTGASDRLIRLGGALAAVPDLGEALRLADRRRVSEAVTAPLFASIGYELELRRIALYTPAAELLWRWTQAEGDELMPARLNAAIRQVRAEEQPVTLLVCQPLCLLHAFVPILAGGTNVGVLALAQSIADFVIDFRAVTGADIGLMVPEPFDEGTALPRWGVGVPALTDATRLQPFLQLVSVLYPDPAALDGGGLVAWQDRHLEVHRLALRRFIRAQGGFVIVISDVTMRLAEIRAMARRGLFATVVTLLVAELFLLYLVRALAGRLRWLAKSLPLLAQGRYGEARGRLAAQPRRASFHDEIDRLFETSETLSHQLEEASAALNAKNRELAEERDLVQGILDAAQILVVTQTRNGVIQMANEYASQLTGLSGAQLRGRRFLDLIADVEDHREVLSKLEALYSKSERRAEHEHDLKRADGKRRQVMWVHTRLHGEDPDRPAVVSVGLDITERVVAESRMRWLANHDTLTGLCNRHRFMEELTRTFDEVTRTGVRAALLLFDLDNFKEINDTSGHGAGDALLRMIADELSARARKSDVVARLGGDEFAVLLPSTDGAGAETLAREINERLRQVPFVHGGRQFRVGASIGIALLPTHGTNVAEVLASADLAMYEAKRAGRGCTRLYSGTPPSGEGGIARDNA